MVTLPAALLVIAWWQRGRLSWRRDVLPLVPFFLLAAAAGLTTVWVEAKWWGPRASRSISRGSTVPVAARAIWFYLGKLFWPANLTFIYPHWTIRQELGWQYLYPAGVLLLLLAAWGLRRRWRGPLAAGSILRRHSLSSVGFFNVFFFRYSYVADHFQYLASLAIMALFAAGVALMRRWHLAGRPV